VERASNRPGETRTAVRLKIGNDGLRADAARRLKRSGVTVSTAADARGHRDGVLVCDASHLTRGAARERRERAVAVVPGHDEAEARRALAAGAAGVVFSDELGSLAATVAAVAVGQLAIPNSMRAAVAKPVLTTREKQIVALVVMGLSNREIADQMFIAESTVKSHLFSAFRRLGVRSRKEATALILDKEQGLGSGILAITQ
jgi:DNA-binding NarL/FixJ family response regulator